MEVLFLIFYKLKYNRTLTADPLSIVQDDSFGTYPRQSSSPPLPAWWPPIHLKTSQISLCGTFNLYVLFSHFRPRDCTPANCFFQMSSYARACLHTDEISWRTSRGLYWESKKYKLKRPYVSWSSIFSCITVKWGIVQSCSHGSLPSFPEGEIACSRCSDRGDSAKRCEQKKITMWGAGSFTAYIFFSLSFSTIRTPGTKTHLSEIGKVGTIYSYFEKGCRRKMCTRQSRKVIWDMINTLFLKL